MAAAVYELDCLYFHFKHLLFSGYEANLQIKSKDGKAYASLTAELSVVDNCKAVKKQKRSPSYFNRLERRKQARKNFHHENKAEKAVHEEDVWFSIMIIM